MCAVQIRILGNHLRLEPDAEFHSHCLHTVNKLLQTAGKLLLIDHPVSECAVVIVSFPEPAVIHDEHFNPAGRRILRNAKELICVKIKIRRLPVVDQNRAVQVLIRTANQMLSEEIMIVPRHLSETIGREGHNHFRRCKHVSRFQLPGKSLRMNSHCHADIPHVLLVCFRKEIPGIYEVHRIDIAVLLIRTRTYQCHERMLLRAGDAAHRSCALPSISKLSPLNMTFPCPGTIQREQLEIPIIHIKCCAQHSIHRQRIFSLVLQNYTSCDHILLFENRIQKLC